MDPSARSAKLSFIEHPAATVSTAPKRRSTDTPAFRVTASGYRTGVRLALTHASLWKVPSTPCVRHTMSHHSALFRAASSAFDFIHVHHKCAPRHEARGTFRQTGRKPEWFLFSSKPSFAEWRPVTCSRAPDRVGQCIPPTIPGRDRPPGRGVPVDTEGIAEDRRRPNRCARSPYTACREEATGRHSRARLNCVRVRVSPAIGSPCQ